MRTRKVEMLREVPAESIIAGQFIRVRSKGHWTIAKVREVIEHAWTRVPTITIWHECGIISCAANYRVEVSV